MVISLLDILGTSRILWREGFNLLNDGNTTGILTNLTKETFWYISESIQMGHVSGSKMCKHVALLVIKLEVTIYSAYCNQQMFTTYDPASAHVIMLGMLVFTL